MFCPTKSFCLFLDESFIATEFEYISICPEQHFSHMSYLGVGGCLTEQGRSSRPTFIYHQRWLT